MDMPEVVGRMTWLMGLLADGKVVLWKNRLILLVVPRSSHGAPPVAVAACALKSAPSAGRHLPLSLSASLSCLRSSLVGLTIVTDSTPPTGSSDPSV
jgi:hypothetical protein